MFRRKILSSDIILTYTSLLISIVPLVFVEVDVVVGKPMELSYRSFLEAGSWIEREKLNMKEKILQLHSQTRGDSSLGASDMRALKWNEDLENLAQTKANKCNFYHGDIQLPDGRHVGQNLAKASGFLENPVESLVKLWMAEKPLFNETLAQCSDGELTSSRIPCGHFHQMVTAETTDIGCAISVCHLCPWLIDVNDDGDDDDNDDNHNDDVRLGKCFWFDVILVCDYFPRGVGEEPAYERGQPCSDCNMKPGTECANNQCHICENVSRPLEADTGAIEITTTATSTPADDSLTSTTLSISRSSPPKPVSASAPALVAATAPTPVAATAPTMSPSAPICRPYKPENCIDEFSSCNAILESDFCTNPLTGMWARRQCRQFCQFC